MVFVIRHDPPQTGDELMAEDSRLLSLMEVNEIAPTLRFYEWIEPTISLGYHQTLETLDLERIADDHQAWTRRPTGGAAVLHSQELTYAVIMPFDGTATASSQIQQFISIGLAEGLRAVGVKADVAERGEVLSSLSNRSSCFVRTSKWEVTANGRKIVGSAQRKMTKALLQHGSILIGNDHLRIIEYLKLSDDIARANLRRRLTEKSTCIADESGRPVEIGRLRDAMETGFRRVIPDLEQCIKMNTIHVQE